MITSVGLQGFGRLALAKVYVKTEAVINEAADAAAGAAAPASEPDRTSTTSTSGSGRYNDTRGAQERGGGPGGERGGVGGGALPDRQPDPQGLLKLNGVSSSIGGIHAEKRKTPEPYNTQQFHSTLLSAMTWAQPPFRQSAYPPSPFMHPVWVI